MNKKLINEIPSEDQALARKLQAAAEDMHITPAFEAKLEAQLRTAHPTKTKLPRNWLTAPTLGWALVVICALLTMNWALRNLIPGVSPAGISPAGGAPTTAPSAAGALPATPLPTAEMPAGAQPICSGQLAILHGFSIFVGRADGGSFTELDGQRQIGELRELAWSPAAGKMLVTGITTGSGDLYLYTPGEGELLRVPSNVSWGYLAGAAWSPDGERLLTWERTKTTRLFITGVDGSAPSSVDLPLQFFETPQFTPDGQSVMFFGADSSTSGLYEFSLENQQVTLISALVEGGDGFAWSPDGARLAYMQMERSLGEAQLVVAGADGKTVIASLPIPTGAGASMPSIANLSWSPDGQSLTFDFGRTIADRGVYLAAADGSGIAKVAETGHAPGFSPDGKCLAFISDQKLYLLEPPADPQSPGAAANRRLLAELTAGRGQLFSLFDQVQWLPEPTPTPGQ